MGLIKLQGLLILTVILTFIPQQVKAQIVNPYNLPISIVQPYATTSPTDQYQQNEEYPEDQSYQQYDSYQQDQANQQYDPSKYNQDQPLNQQSNSQPNQYYPAYFNSNRSNNTNFEHRKDRKCSQEHFAHNEIKHKESII